jgi:hypothetical protein
LLTIMTVMGVAVGIFIAAVCAPAMLLIGALSKAGWPVGCQ